MRLRFQDRHREALLAEIVAVVEAVAPASGFDDRRIADGVGIEAIRRHLEAQVPVSAHPVHAVRGNGVAKAVGALRSAAYRIEELPVSRRVTDHPGAAETMLL